VKNFFLVLILLFSNGLFAKGVAKGLRLSEIEQGSIYQQLGLQNGDVILKVNGAAPDSVEALNAILSGKKAGDKFELVIDRKGKEKTLHYTIK
jgi:S1-C subfamily serine protease